MTTALIKLKSKFITVTGKDAEKFLQGQMSCDLSLIDSNKACFGTLNTPKGRMYAFFKIIRIDEGFLFCVQEDTFKLVLEKLKKYVIFFKCDLSEAETFKSYGLINQPNSNTKNSLKLPQLALALLRSDENITLQLPCKPDMYEVWSPDSLSDIDDHQAQEAWFAQETLNGLPELYSETQEKFILQYLNLQDLGAVSFNKGCYTGQEIIARMKFLGKQKKKMYLLKSETQYCASPHSEIYDSKGVKCGTTVRSHYSKETGSVALGILNINYTENESLVFLDSNLVHEFRIIKIQY